MALNDDVKFEAKDNRFGMGIGGFDHNVTATHEPSGITMHFPHLNFNHRDRTAILEAFEYMFHEMRKWEYIE